MVSLIMSDAYIYIYIYIYNVEICICSLPASLCDQLGEAFVQADFFFLCADIKTESSFPQTTDLLAT